MGDRAILKTRRATSKRPWCRPRFAARGPAWLAVSVALLAAGCGDGVRREAATPTPNEVVDTDYNRVVTLLVEDCESVRLAVGTAWDAALACRALSGYARPWRPATAADPAEALVSRGARLYELVKCVDDGITSVRLARDAGETSNLPAELKFWRNELARAAGDVCGYADEAMRLKAQLADELRHGAAERGLSAQMVPDRPWPDPAREAWRAAGPSAGIRLPLLPRPGSLADWWNRKLGVEPGYLVGKFASAGDRFVTPEVPAGAWGEYGTGPDAYDWRELNRLLRQVQAAGAHLLLELPTLQAAKSTHAMAAAWADADRRGDAILDDDGFVRCVPAYLTNQPAAQLVSRQADGALRPYAGVQLFDPATAQAYGRYLQALAGNLKAQGLEGAIAAIHLESGDWAQLPEQVDYSDVTLARWRAFLAARYASVDALNQAAGTTYTGFDQVPLPVRAVDPRAAAVWQEFGAIPAGAAEARAWGNYLTKRYKTPDAIRAALGDDYRDGYGWRLPLVYPPVIGIDYLHFRRAWVRDYLAIKRGLVAAAFPHTLCIDEMRQFGDHDGVQGLGERTWGGFLSEDHAQWTGTGPDNARRPFMLRSVGAVGFGTRPSDSLESLYRDYLWLNFRNPGNLARYFYHWVAHGYLDYQFGWHSVHSHWLSNQLLYRLGPTVANTAPEPQRVGLLFPRASYDLAPGDVYYGYLGWDWVLQAAKLPYTRIDEATVRAGRLSELPVEVLILPEVTALDVGVATNLAAWVARGGLLVASTVPGKTDGYGRVLETPALTDVLGVRVAGTVCEDVAGTPLTVTVPHGHYSGIWQTASDRQPAFEVLRPAAAAQVLATYTSGVPAIVAHAYGRGRAVTLGYPFGREAVQCERTSLGFQRTYVWFAREPQLVARTAWLRQFLTRDLGVPADYTVTGASVARFRGVEEIAPGFHMPKGLSSDPADPFYIRMVGDPRPGHALEVARETPDLALRFFPRARDGLATRYLGISTREVHYLGPRATANMILAQHSYDCRIDNPRIQSLWDVGRDVPVGFTRDAGGIGFTVSLPSGHIMLLAWSETPQVEIFGPAPFPGRDTLQVLARCRQLTGGRAGAKVAVLTPARALDAWARELAVPLPAAKGATQALERVLISYGDETNRPAAERLCGFLQRRYGLRAETIAQRVARPARPEAAVGKEHEEVLVFLGNEWSNNDLAMHGAYWGLAYGAHLPFTSTYAWPGPGRAVVALSRAHALCDANGSIPFSWNPGHNLRPVERRFQLLRRKLHIAGDGPDADAAVECVIRLMERVPAGG